MLRRFGLRIVLLFSTGPSCEAVSAELVEPLPGRRVAVRRGCEKRFGELVVGGHGFCEVKARPVLLRERDHGVGQLGEPGVVGIPTGRLIIGEVDAPKVRFVRPPA